MLGVYKTGARNRSTFAAHAAGRTIDELANEYLLTRTRLAAILTSERHRIAVSPDPNYCDLRDRIDPAVWLYRQKPALIP